MLIVLNSYGKLILTFFPTINDSKSLINLSESFKQGIYFILSPPDCIKVSLPLIFISSNVSRQSEINEGQSISIDLEPDFGNSANLLSVNGFSQPGPIVYWKAISHLSFSISKASVTSSVVLIT